MPPRRYDDSRSTGKIILLLFLIISISGFTSVVLTSYPQHIFVDNRSIIGQVKFIDDNTLLIKGNQVAYGTNDLIPLKGRDYIRITGRQAQIGEYTYNEAIRTLTAAWNQNVLFEQEVGEFGTGGAVQVGVDKTEISLSSLSRDTIQVSSRNNNYVVEFVQDTVYINEGVMLKLEKKGDMIKVYLVGVKDYKKIWMRYV